jgi:hypothetical protein
MQLTFLIDSCVYWPICFRRLQNQDILLDLVHKATEISFTDWVFRIKLIDVICFFIYLFPDVAQVRYFLFVNKNTTMSNVCQYVVM